MNRIKGKTVIITGASSGIGEACSRIFASHGANLLLVARRKEKLASLQENLLKENQATVKIYELDVCDREKVKDWAGQLKQEGLLPDILINNAGLASGLNKLHEGDFTDWDRMIDTNVKGLLNVSRVILPVMVERNEGHVVNIGSIAGHMVYPSGNVYCATKYAVRAINEGMNIDLYGTNIRVSSIDPGAVETEFSRVRFKGDETRAAKVYEGFAPLKPEDIADAVFYVVNSPEHVNIQDLVIMPTAQRNPYLLHREGK